MAENTVAHHNDDTRTRQLADASSKVVLRSHASPVEDIRSERDSASFRSQELAEYLNEGPDKLKRRGELIELLQQQPWGSKRQRYHLTRKEEYVEALRGILGIWELMNTGKLNREDALEARKLLAFPGGLELHLGMFIPTLMSQASEEQQDYWLPKAMRLEAIGAYAQTELGHGTFVRGLETTATYDVETQEFIVHSPEDTSTKWWPGGLGKTANHTILLARLFIKGKDYGPHTFVMQIRDVTTHEPLPGIDVGDIGPKFGYNSVDNGYMRFNYVRLPREAMLCRFAKVAPDGTYQPPPPANQKASYATLVYVRATIVEEAGWYLAKSLTIAVRYTAVRRQTAAKVGEKETQVLNYQNTAFELLPLLGSAYALIFMGKAGWEMYRLFDKQRNKGDFSILPELHATLSGLKALGTTIASNGMEACRRCCGGHGYSLSSGLPTLFASYVQNATWEGDTNVLFLQQARSLVKALGSAQKGQAVGGHAAYLQHMEQELGSKSGTHSAECWRNPDHVTAALRHRAARLCVAAAKKLHASGGGQIHFDGPAWNGNTVDTIRVAKAHSMYVLQKTFKEAVARLQKEQTVSQQTAAALGNLLTLFGTFTLVQDLGDYLEDGFLSGSQAAALRTMQYMALSQVRPDAVALVDAFGFDDYQLNSTIGRYDGDVYTALLEDTQLSSLNDSPQGPAWEAVIKPALEAQRPRAKM